MQNTADRRFSKLLILSAMLGVYHLLVPPERLSAKEKMTRYLLTASLPLPARRTLGTASPGSSQNARSARPDPRRGSRTSCLREIRGRRQRRRPCAPTSRASTRLRLGGRQRACPTAPRGVLGHRRARPSGAGMNEQFNLARSARAANDAAGSGGGQVCACRRLTQGASRAAWCRRRSPRPPAGPAPSSPRPATRRGCGGGAAATADSARGCRTPPSHPPRPLRAASPRGSRCADPPGRAARTPVSGGRAPSGRDRPQAPSSVPSPPTPGLDATRVLTPRSPLTPGLAGDHEALEVSSAPSGRASASAAGCARRGDAARGPVWHVSNVEGCSVPRSRRKGRGAPRRGRAGPGAEGDRSRGSWPCGRRSRPFLRRP